MTEFHPRLFHSDAEIARIGEGLVELHPAAGRMDPRSPSRGNDVFATQANRHRRDRDLPDMIRSYNESVGGVNSDTEGYHETITRVFLLGVRLFYPRPARPALHEPSNDLLRSPMGGAIGRFASTVASFCFRN